MTDAQTADECFQAGVRAALAALDQFTAPKGSGDFGWGYIVAREGIRKAIEGLIRGEN